MKKNWLSAGLTAAVLAVASAAPAQAAVFNFSFNGGSTGTGTFSFDGAASAGTFALGSLSDYAFDFTVNSKNFTTADLATPLNNILVSFTTSGQDLLVHFGGSTGGPFGGSIDFTHGGNFLSFEPNFGSRYYDGALGTYAGVLDTSSAVPEPLSASLVGLGLAGIFGVRRRRS